MRRSRGERGQAVPLMLVLIVVAMVGVAVVARLGVAADEAARARTAADASALAGAAQDQNAAERLALANGASLVEFERHGSFVEVVVRVGSARARARAELRVEWGISP